MKNKFVIAVLLLAGMGLASAETKEMTKASLLEILQTSCVDAGNTDSSCKCAVNALDTGLTDEEWTLFLATTDQTKKIGDMEKVKELQLKADSIVKKCGANK